MHLKEGTTMMKGKYNLTFLRTIMAVRRLGIKNKETNYISLGIQYSEVRICHVKSFKVDNH